MSKSTPPTATKPATTATTAPAPTVQPAKPAPAPPRATSDAVAAKAAHLVRTSTDPDVRSVAASAVSQSVVNQGANQAVGGVKSAAVKIVEALEAAGMDDAADIARDVAGLPPRPVTPDQDFIRSVRATVDARKGVVGFQCDNVEQRDRREWLIAGLTPSVPGYTYSVRRRGTDGLYLEVVLA